MSTLTFLDPKLLEKIIDEDIFFYRKHSEFVTIAKQKRDVILNLILDPAYKVYSTKLEAYNLFKSGLSHQEIAKRLNISEQVSKNYKSEVTKKIMILAGILENV